MFMLVILEHFNTLIEQISKLGEALFNIQFEQHWLEAQTECQAIGIYIAFNASITWCFGYRSSKRGENLFSHRMDYEIMLVYLLYINSHFILLSSLRVYV